jgi:hypothetical protein
VKSADDPEEEFVVVDNSPFAMAMDDIKNVVYVSHLGSNTVTIINGTDNKLLYQTDFKITPANSGKVRCDNIEIFSNYSFLSSKRKCEAIPNSGYVFSSWSYSQLEENKYNVNYVKELKDNYDIFREINKLLKSLSNIIGISDNTVDISKHGVYQVNFLSQEQIPKEFWTPFYAIIPSFFIPTILKTIMDRRNDRKKFIKNENQKNNFNKLINRLNKMIDENKSGISKSLLNKEIDNIEREIFNSFAEESISDSQYKLLGDKLVHYKKKLDLE